MVPASSHRHLKRNLKNKEVDIKTEFESDSRLGFTDET